MYNRLLSNRANSREIIFGIQGGKGSFNEQALSDYVVRHRVQDYEVKYLYTTENVLQELLAGKIDYGQFAVHNSTGGIVEESIKAMANYKFKIVEEFGIVIEHYLMKPKDVDISEIDTIMTHPQVLKQCRENLRKKYSHLKLTSGKNEMIDQARLAKEIATGSLQRNIAVMGPKILSDIYKLEIIDGPLQDQKHNLTSFLMVECST